MTTKTHCVSGRHERTPENIGGRSGRNGSGTTFCKACKRENRRKRLWGFKTPTPGVGRPTEDSVADWLELKEQGYSVREAAARLGMNPGALHKAIERGRQRGLIA